jgi:hypothetical protein
MPSWNSFSFAFGPLVTFLGLGIMVLVLRWAFGGRKSLIERSVTADHSTNYGLMKVAASPANLIEGEMQRRALVDSGIRANLTNTLDGPKIMVWPEDLVKARKILK